VFEEISVKKNHISWRHRFQTAPFSKCFPASTRNRKAVYSNYSCLQSISVDGRPTVEIKLRLKIKFLWRSMDATKATWYKITHTAVWYWETGRRILRARIQLLDRWSTWLLDVHWRLSSSCAGATVWRCFVDFQNFAANQTTNNCTTNLTKKTQFDWFPTPF